LIRLRPPIPAPRITSFLFTFYLFFVKRVLRATQVGRRGSYLVRSDMDGRENVRKQFGVAGHRRIG
jgi:hypothetical protein